MLLPEDGLVWLGYLAFNHSRTPLKTLDKNRDTLLQSTAHGALVVDLKKNRHAWIYVYPGGNKLRFPSIVGGQFKGNKVLLQVQFAEEETVSIDLSKLLDPS